MFIFSRDHVSIKHKEPSVVGAMVPEQRPPASWAPGTHNSLQLEGQLNTNKSKMRMDHQTWHQQGDPKFQSLHYRETEWGCHHRQVQRWLSPHITQTPSPGHGDTMGGFWTSSRTIPHSQISFSLAEGALKWLSLPQHLSPGCSFSRDYPRPKSYTSQYLTWALHCWDPPGILDIIIY